VPRRHTITEKSRERPHRWTTGGSFIFAMYSGTFFVSRRRDDDGDMTA
jgi:hypothetical protein